MYREGPEGTPFHTLCLDGIVDGDFPSGKILHLWRGSVTLKFCASLLDWKHEEGYSVRLGF